MASSASGRSHALSAGAAKQLWWVVVARINVEEKFVSMYIFGGACMEYVFSDGFPSAAALRFRFVYGVA